MSGRRQARSAPSRDDARRSGTIPLVLHRVSPPPEGSHPGLVGGPVARGWWSWRSILVGADDITTGTSAQCPPGLEADRILDEFHRAIREGDVDAAGVVTRRRTRTLRIDE